MKFIDMEVKAHYKVEIGEGRTIWINLWGRDKDHLRLIINTTGVKSVGDAILSFGEVDKVAEAVKEVEADFLSRFEFREVK